MHLRQIQWILWVCAGLAAAGFAAMSFWVNEPQQGGATGDQPAYRADFELTDHRGMVQRDEDFEGKWLLIFFGFANCPDVCPTTLAEVAAVMDALNSDAETVQPLFISIDPERDTPAALAEFVPRFEAGIIGLTGTPDQIARTAKNFYIYYEKIEEAASPDGYSMGHSSQLFLFGPDGEFVRVFAYGTPAEEIVQDLKARLAG